MSAIIGRAALEHRRSRFRAAMALARA